MPPIRILHLITSLDIGGAEITLARLVGGLNPQEFESRVVSLIPPGPVMKLVESQGIPVDSLWMQPGQVNPAGLFNLIRLLRAYQPDILQTWLYHADFLGLLAGKLSGISTIAWNIRTSSMDFTRYRPLSGLVARACALLSTLPQVVVVNSETGWRHHEQFGYHPRRWELIPNGVDTALFSPNPSMRSALRSEWGLFANQPVVGLVGRLDPQKDHPNFLSAAAQVIQKYPAASFVCVGDGPSNYLRDLKTLTRTLGLEQQVIWAGPHRQMSAVYNAFDLLVLSSYGEGFPNVVAEAMACGVPCVVTDVGDARRIVGDCGVVVPPRDSTALAEGLLRLLLLSAAERQAIGRRARQRIQDKFSLVQMLAAYKALYLSLSSQEEQL